MRLGVRGIGGEARSCSGDGKHGQQVGVARLLCTGVEGHPGVRGQVAAKGAVLAKPSGDAVQRSRRVQRLTCLGKKIAQLCDLMCIADRHIFNL